MSKLTDLLLKHEGFRTVVYDDATGKPVVPGYTMIGHPTIGIGRALDTTGISPAEAQALLDSDLNRALHAARKYPWFSSLSMARQDVVVCMIFNLGPKGFSNFKNTIAAIAAGDFKSAAEHMIKSQWAVQVGPRAAELALMMNDGSY